MDPAQTALPRSLNQAFAVRVCPKTLFFWHVDPYIKLKVKKVLYDVLWTNP